MRKLWWLSILSVLAACGGEKPSEEALQNHAAQAVVWFFEGCAAHLGAAAGVAAWAQQQGFQPLNAAAVKKLPLGMIELDALNVWQAEKDGGRFYLSTLPEQGCSVKAAEADEATVRSRFAERAEQGVSGVTVAKRADHYTASPFPFSQLVYAWYQTGQSTEILLTANTSPAKQVPAQASLSFNREPVRAATVVNP